jgi:hypothetical protein
MAFTTHKCPACGDLMQISNDGSTLECPSCRTKLVDQDVVQTDNRAKTETRKKIQNLIKLGDTARDSGKSKDAYNYYVQVLELDVNNPLAWYGRSQSLFIDYNNFLAPTNEIVVCYKNALDGTVDNDKDQEKKLISKTIEEQSSKFFNIIYSNNSYRGTWENYLTNCRQLIAFLEFGYNLDPNSQIIIKSIVTLCQTNLGGIKYDPSLVNNGEGVKGQSIDRTTIMFGVGGAFLLKKAKIVVRRLNAADSKYYADKMDFYYAKLKALDPTAQPPKISKQYSPREMMIYIGLICIVLIIVIQFIWSILFNLH